ncbi:MAG: glycoside hydrolase family 2 TIM barrel-domain containing protein, partial [Bacteroidota bacterium]
MKKIHSYSCLCIPLAIVMIVLFSCSREKQYGSDWDPSFLFEWKFAGGDQPGAREPGFDDSAWETVDLPHDWAIKGPFGPLDSNGSTGKLPWKGEGWYRKSFDLPAGAEEKRLQFLFDGVMANPTVYLNGKEVGSWIYGYNSFWIDATDAAIFGGNNVLAVHADTREHHSRWYPGAGIYRKVGMRLAGPVHIPVWGVFVTTPEVSDQQAVVNTAVEITNASGESQGIDVEVTLLDPDGTELSSGTVRAEVNSGETARIEQVFEIENPRMWDIEHPDQYTCRTRLLQGNKVMDVETTPFGVRTFRWTADDGFHLNGRRVQLYGVNLHHGHGPLGAAFFPRAMERQLEIMKDMGVNALRTSHNACAPEVLDLCDRMGIIVWNELFDKYGPTAGVQCSTEEYVEKYAEREVANFVRRDRNHPCVFIWSIANEAADLLSSGEGTQSDEFINAMAGYFEDYDTTRPTTMGCHIPSASVGDQRILEGIETTGWNYGRRYWSTRKAYPEMPLIYSESASCFGTRGAYKPELPGSKIDYGNDGELTAYMLTSARWSDIPEHEFEYMRIDTFMAGEFVWTGFDYLGEPTPVTTLDRPGGSRPVVDDSITARSSYFGIVDLAGLPKDSYYNYRSLWNKKENTVYLSPHWNWEGHEGEKIPVFLYTSGDEAELFLNGVSLGRRQKIDPDQVKTSMAIRESLDYSVRAGDEERPYFEIVDAYRLRWLDVAYEPGEMKAVAYRDGEMIGEAVVKTAGEPARLALTPDRTRMNADGMDLCYITIEMVDSEGVLCPWAMDMLEFKVEGSARLMGVANGHQRGHDVFTDATHPLFYG